MLRCNIPYYASLTESPASTWLNEYSPGCWNRSVLRPLINFTAHSSVSSILAALHTGSAWSSHGCSLLPLPSNHNRKLHFFSISNTSAVLPRIVFGYSCMVNKHILFGVLAIYKTETALDVKPLNCPSHTRKDDLLLLLHSPALHGLQLCYLLLGLCAGLEAGFLQLPVVSYCLLLGALTGDVSFALAPETADGLFRSLDWLCVGGLVLPLYD